MANTINWFEIPVQNFERAKKFYGAILGRNIEEQQFGDDRMGFLSGMQEKGIGGAIVHGRGYEPSDKGALIYLNGGDDLNVMLSKVEPAGGKVVLPKTLINEDIGFFATFIDSEGNKIALHSSK